MYQTFRPLLEALKQRGADPAAVDRAAEEAERTGRSIRAVLINDHTAFRTDWMPFAGRRQSGYGVGGIPWTMQEMADDKMVVLNGVS